MSAITVIVEDDFSGTSGTNLNGTTTDTGGKTWSADALFKADGSYSTTNGSADRGAALDLGAGFFASQFALGNKAIELTVHISALGSSNSFAYAGFSTDAWYSGGSPATADFYVGARAHTQGITLGLEYDTIGAFSSNIHRDTLAGDTGTEIRNELSTTAQLIYTLRIAAGATGYNASTVTLSDGVDSVSLTGYNAASLRTLYLGVEATSGTSTANFDLIRLVAVPEPGISLLGALSMLAFATRRRR